MAIMTDPIADMLTRIRNGLTAKHEVVEVPESKIKVAIADILVKEGYISGYEVVGRTEGRPDLQGTIKITLKYVGKNQKVITGLKKSANRACAYMQTAITFLPF